MPSSFPRRLANLSLLLALTPLASGLAQKPNLPLPQMPKGLKANIFAGPPMANYPTFVCATPNGEVFVSVDKNGSLDRKEDRGSIIKLVDTDKDGVADKRTEFASKVTSPRGLEWIGNDTLVCLHPPEVTIFRDKDGDGVAEERKDIVTGIGFTLKDRAPDHTSNGVTLGIDGWLYLAIGDFGFMEATGSDGKKLQLHAGGVVRIRPDGSEMELFARGTRNIYGVAVDPWLNLFARDNTNDGGGWDTRLEFYLHGVDLGYPRRFKHFTDETFPVLGIYGGGSGVSGIYVQEKNFGWPQGYDDTLYTCDWGRSQIFRHSLKDAHGAFETQQDTLCNVERVTDMKVDALGNAYIASWRGGQFSYKDENVGYLIRVSPEQPVQKEKPIDLDFAKKSLAALVDDVTNPDSHTRRMHASQEMVKRISYADAQASLEKAIANTKLTGPARIAALFTLKQIGGEKANPFIVKQLSDSTVREFALRALGDRATQGANVPTEALVAHLKDANAHVRSQAVIALDRLKRKEAAPALLAVAAEDPESASAPAKPAAVAAPLWESTQMSKAKPTAECQVALKGVKTLYLVATDAGDGDGTDHVAWLNPLLKGPAGSKPLTELKWASTAQGWGKTAVNKNATGGPISVQKQIYPSGIGSHAISVIRYDLPAKGGWEHFTATAAMEDTGLAQGNGGSVVMAVYAEELPPALASKVKGGAPAPSGAELIYTDLRRCLPHVASQALIQLGASDAAFAALDAESTQRQASLRVLRNLHTPEVVSGLISRLEKATEPALQHGLVTALTRLYFKEARWDGGSWGTRPDTSGPYYKRATWEETPKIETTLLAWHGKATPDGQKHLAAELARHQVTIKSLATKAVAADPQWAKDQEYLGKAMAGMSEMKDGDIGLLEPPVAMERTLAALNSGKANPKNGEKLFVSQGCIACHVTGEKDAPKGPNLYDIARRYSPQEVLTSIINPSATVSQGFPTQVVTMKNGDVQSGFAMKEGGDEHILRNMAAMTTVVPTSQIKSVLKDEHVSSMTPGLLNNLSPAEAADMLEYFRSLVPKEK